MKANRWRELSGPKLCACCAVLAGMDDVPRVFAPYDPPVAVGAILIESLLLAHPPEWKQRDAAARRFLAPAVASDNIPELLEEISFEAKSRWGDGSWHFETLIVSPLHEGACNHHGALSAALDHSAVSRHQLERRDADASAMRVTVRAGFACGRTVDPACRALLLCLERHWQSKWYRPQSYLRDGDPGLAVPSRLLGEGR